MKRGISCILIICMVVIGINSNVLAESNEKYGYLTCIMEGDNKIVQIPVRITGDLVAIDGIRLADLVGLDAKRNSEGLVIKNHDTLIAYIFKKNSAKVRMLGTFGSIEYTAPLDIKYKNDTVWIPLAFSAMLMNINIRVKSQRLVLSKPYESLFSVINRVTQYSFDWKELGYYPSTESHLLAVSSVTNFLNRITETTGMNLFEMILGVHGLGMDEEYADKLCNLMDFSSRLELEKEIETLTLFKDLFSKEGTMRKWAEQVLYTTGLDFKFIMEQISSEMKNNSAYLYSSDGRRAINLLSKNIRDEKNANIIVEIQKKIDISKYGIDNKIEIFSYGLQVLEYMHEFSQKDEFSISALDYVLDRSNKISSQNTQWVDTMQITNERLMRDKTTYVISEFLRNNWKDYFFEDLKLKVYLSGSMKSALLRGKMVLLVWDIGKNIVPFVKKGLNLTDKIELTAYAMMLQGVSIEVALKEKESCIKNGKVRREGLYNMAKAYYVYLKSCYIARNNAIEATKIKLGKKYKKLRDSMEVNEDKLNDETLSKMVILKQATDDTDDRSCYGLLPDSDINYDDSSIIEIVTENTNDEKIKNVKELDIVQAINQAATFAFSWFWDNQYYDQSQSVMKGEMEFCPIVKNGISTESDVKALTQRYFTEEATKKMMQYRYWMEKDNRLYTSANEGLGGVVVSNWKIQIKKQSDTQYEIKVNEY